MVRIFVWGVLMSSTGVRYLNLNDCGRILGYGCGTPSMTRYSKYPEEAYELGKGL